MLDEAKENTDWVIEKVIIMRSWNHMNSYHNCCSSIAKWYPTLYNLVDCSTQALLLPLSPSLVKFVSIEWMPAQLLRSFWTFCNLMDQSPPDTSVHGIFLARMREWVAALSLQGILPTWDEAHSSYTAHSFFTGESPRKPHPLSRWCYLTNSSSATLFFCLHSFPASGSFPMSWLFTSGGQIIGVSLSASILPNSIQGWFLLELTSWISLKLGLSKVCSSFTIQKHQIFGILPSLWSHLNMTAGKTIALAIWTFVDIMMSLLFNTLPRFVTVFFSRNKHLLISWLQSPSTVNLDPKKIKSVTASTFLLLFSMKWWDWNPWS